MRVTITTRVAVVMKRHWYERAQGVSPGFRCNVWLSLGWRSRLCLRNTRQSIRCVLSSIFYGGCLNVVSIFYTLILVWVYVLFEVVTVSVCCLRVCVRGPCRFPLPQYWSLTHWLYRRVLVLRSRQGRHSLVLTFCICIQRWCGTWLGTWNDSWTDILSA